MQAKRVKLDAHPCNGRCKDITDRANHLLDLRLYKDAILVAGEELKRNPGCPLAGLLGSWALYGDGQMRKALDMSRAGVKAHPKTADFCNIAGRALEALDLPDEAIASYRRAIEISPEVGAYCANLASALCVQGLDDEAAEQARLACRASQDDPSVLHAAADTLLVLGHDEEALEHAKESIRLFSRYKDSYTICVTALMNLERADELLKTAGEFAQKFPHYIDALLSRAAANAIAGDAAEAYRDVAAAKRIDSGRVLEAIPDIMPEDARDAARRVYEAYSLAADTYDVPEVISRGAADGAPVCPDCGNPMSPSATEEGKFECRPSGRAIQSEDFLHAPGAPEFGQAGYAALEQADRALAHAKSYAVLNERGIILSRMARRREAVSAFREAIGLEPGLPEAHCNMAVAMLLLKNPAEALAAADASLHAGKSVQALHARAGALLMMSRNAESLECFEEITSVHPQDALAHGGAARALLSLGRQKEALAAFDRSLELSPDDGRMHAGRGMALALANRLKEAIACYDRSIEIDPSYMHAHANKGIALMAIGDEAGAKAHFDIVKEADPELLAGVMSDNARLFRSG